MKKKLQFAGTLFAAALLTAGTAHAQTGNGGLRGVVGGTLSTLRINVSVGGSNASATQASATRGRVGVVRTMLRPYARPGARRLAAGTSSASADGSLPGLDRADAQMREEGSDLSGDGNDTVSTTDDTSGTDGMGDDVMQTTSDADDMAGTGGAALEPSGATRRTGTSDRTTTDFRTSRGATSSDRSIGVLGVSVLQFGHTTAYSNQQQDRRNTRSGYRNNEMTFAPPEPETPAEDPATGADDAAPEGSGGEAAGETTTSGDAPDSGQTTPTAGSG